MLDFALKPSIRHSLITWWFLAAIFLPPYFLEGTYIVHVWEAWPGVCKTIHFTTLFKTRDLFSWSLFISFCILNYFLTITWQNNLRYLKNTNIDLLFIQNVLNIVYLLINFLQNIKFFFVSFSAWFQNINRFFFSCENKKKRDGIHQARFSSVQF